MEGNERFGCEYRRGMEEEKEKEERLEEGDEEDEEYKETENTEAEAVDDDIWNLTLDLGRTVYLDIRLHTLTRTFMAHEGKLHPTVLQDRDFKLNYF